MNRMSLRTSALAFALFLFATGSARALELSAVTQAGVDVPAQWVHHTYQGLEVAIHDQLVATRATYRFHNAHEEPVELTCSLSLSQGEMIDGFSYWNGEERIRGEVLERQAASHVYEQLANVERRDPGILEQDGQSFRFRVFPVAPEEEKPVEVRSMSILSRREGWLEYAIPQGNLPAGDGVFSLSLDVTDDLPIVALETLGFEGRVERVSPHHRRVRFEANAAQFDGDLKVRYRLAGDAPALRFVSHRGDGEDGSFALIVSPQDAVAAQEIVGRDVVFVLDVSGSMDGEPLSQAKAGLDYALSRLNPQDRFEVVAFDDESRSLLGGLRAAEADALTGARTAVLALETGGGTNIDGALSRALELLSQASEGRPQAIIFLTDGQGSTPPEVVAAHVREQSRGVRIYSFGAGAGVNRPFLQRLSDDNRGVATFIQDERQIEQEMRRLYDRIAMPLMVDLSLAFEGLSVHSVYPKQLPDLYADSEVVVVGRFSQAGKGEVVVTGKRADRAERLSLPVSLPKVRAADAPVEKVWAARRIDHLLGTLSLRGQDPELVQEVTRLGIVYNLVTPYTTFLAVPESLQTDAIRELMRQGKQGYEQRLVDTMKSVRLSQTHIPPGDPVLTVAAPADARRVEAYFPFGLVKRLRYDSLRERWHVRFLVPRDVPDGVYTVQIQIVEADGHERWESIDYVIDATAPEFELTAASEVRAGQSLQVAIDPFEPVAEAWLYVDALQLRLPLLLDVETGRYATELPVPAELADSALALRVVVRDLARNRHERSWTTRITR